MAEVNAISRWRRILPIVLAGTMVAAACGSSGDSNEAVAQVEGETTVAADPVPTATPEPTAVPAPEPTATAEPTAAPEPEVERIFEPLPVHDDPCANRLEVGTHQFSIMLDDEGKISELPIDILVFDSTLTAETPALVVDFHGASNASIRAYPDKEGASRTVGGLVAVHPSADTSAAPFWAQTTTYDAAIVDQLWAALLEGVCFDPERVGWFGTGQGSTLAIYVVCSTDLPAVVAFFSMGMAIRRDCDPRRPVPIVSFDVFQFHPNSGANWDEAWTPPVPHLAEQFDMGPTPDVLDTWAALYNCTDERKEETLPDPDDWLTRDSVVFSYSDCDAPLSATGVENAPNGQVGPNPAAVHLLDASGIFQLLAPAN